MFICFISSIYIIKNFFIFLLLIIIREMSNFERVNSLSHQHLTKYRQSLVYYLQTYYYKINCYNKTYNKTIKYTFNHMNSCNKRGILYENTTLNIRRSH